MIARSRDIGEGRWSASQRRASAMADNSAVRSVWASAPKKKEEEEEVITGPHSSAIDLPSSFWSISISEPRSTIWTPYPAVDRLLDLEPTV